jgi:hypothetical protein
VEVAGNLALKDPRLSSLFHYLSSIGRLDCVRFLKSHPRSPPPTDSVDVWGLDFVVTGGTLSVVTPIALRGVIRECQRRMKTRPVSVVSFRCFCDLPRGERVN